MLNAYIRKRYLHYARTLRDPDDPLVNAKRRQTPRDSFDSVAAMTSTVGETCPYQKVHSH